MSMENNAPEKDENPGASSGDGDLQKKLNELMAERDAAAAEAAKYRKLQKDAIAERDALKKQAPVQKNDEDYKQLWTETTDKLSKTLERVKTADINSALSAQLTKAGLSQSWFDAAVKLVDRDLVEWNEDTGVDRQSITAAVAKLKSAYPAMFEKLIKGVDPKDASNGSSESKTMTRQEFDRLDPIARAKRMREGWKLTE